MIRLRHPVPGARISQRFGENPGWYAQWGLAGHNGLDFAVPIGTPVRAAHDGQVTNRAEGPYGVHTTLEGATLRTLYGHLDTAVLTTGEWVAEGAVLGTSGNTGNSTGPHLHLGLQIRGQPNPAYGDWVDPYPYLVEATSVEAAIGAALQEHIMPLNPQAAFERAGISLGLLPASAEFDVVVDGAVYRAQGYRSPGRPDVQHVVYCIAGDWDNLRWFVRQN